MFRYLSAAFWAGPRIPGFGHVPWNALAVLGVGMFGFVEPAVWLAGAGLETVYLFSLATNSRFQNWVEAMRLAATRSDTDQARQRLLSTLGGASKQRYNNLVRKIGNVEKLYRQSSAEEYLFESNKEALQKLSWLFLKLLIAQQNIGALASQTNEYEIQKNINLLQTELSQGVASPALRESKEATLKLLTQRLQNMRKRDESLAEVASDLTRIEHQVDLAVEDASLRGKPTAISANIGLVSHLLNDTFDVPPAPEIDAPATTTSSSSGKGTYE